MIYTDYNTLREKLANNEKLSLEEKDLFNFRVFISKNIMRAAQIDSTDEKAALEFMMDFFKAFPDNTINIGPDMFSVKNEYLYMLEEGEVIFMQSIAALMTQLRNNYLKSVNKPIPQNTSDGGSLIQTNNNSNNNTAAVPPQNNQNQPQVNNKSYKGAMSSILGQFG